jgi:outer membrane receptor protein involved in Fe transport
VLTGQVPIEEGLLIEDDHFHYLKLERFRARSAALLPDHWEALVRYHHNTLEYALPRQTQQYRNHDFFAQAQASYLGTRQRLELSLQYQANLLFGNNLAIDFVPVGQVSRGQLNLGALHQWVKPLDSLGLRLKTESILRFNYLQQYGLLPNAGFRAHLGQADRSEAFVGGHTGYRLPAFNELYYFSYGNAGLQPERVVEVEGGGVWRKTLLLPFSLKLNAFFNQTRNKIISVPINPARWSTLAVGLSQSLGLEAALDISLGARGRVYYHHTLQDVRDLSRAEKPFLPYTPPEIINYGLSWQGERLRFQLHAAYSSWRFALLQNGADSYLPPYHILDASMGYLIKMKKISYLIVGEVENVGNVSYAVIRSYPMPPRMFRLALILKY